MEEQQIKLQVAGIGYTSEPAGSDGDVVYADLTGPKSDEIAYRVDQDLLGKLGHLFGVSDRVGTAYLSRDMRTRLATQGVLLKEEEVRGAGISNYVLWRLSTENEAKL